MVGRVLRHYVKEERRIPVLEVLVRFLNDEITKTEVHTPAIEPFPHPPVADASAPPTPLSQKFAFSRPSACTRQTPTLTPALTLTPTLALTLPLPLPLILNLAPTLPLT